MIESTYSWLSLVGLVSSNRRWQRPPNSAAMPKSMEIAWAWPMCRYPFGSGGKRVITRPPNRPLALCSRMMSRMKFVGFSRGSSVIPLSVTHAPGPCPLLARRRAAPRPDDQQRASSVIVRLSAPVAGS